MGFSFELFVAELIKHGFIKSEFEERNFRESCDKAPWIITTLVRLHDEIIQLRRKDENYMRYKIVGDYVTYGGPSPYKAEVTYNRNMSLTEAIDFIKSRILLKDVELNTIYSTKEDRMGCYNRFEIREDHDVETMWHHLTKAERRELFEYAEAWMGNEMAEIPALAEKIKNFE